MTDKELEKIFKERQKKIQRYSKELEKVTKLLEKGKIDDDEAHRRLQKVAVHDI